ncbi:MAG: hypothetical protein KAT05_01450 [Spirochaetes bacterium]|nr:hypothetical protein [Spirochaetota bacterium]
MLINFKCTKCKKIFDSEVGKISINEETMRPDFEFDINCPNCEKRTIDEVTLTELGQSQLTEATFNL